MGWEGRGGGAAGGVGGGGDGGGGMGGGGGGDGWGVGGKRERDSLKKTGVRAGRLPQQHRDNKGRVYEDVSCMVSPTTSHLLF